jgi:hypothetical protein
MSEDQPSYVDRRQWKYNPMTGEVTPLYTAPPQREWQGLTDEDVGKVSDEFLEGVLWAEAKLKEKNA